MLSFDTSSTITGYAYWENGILKDSGVIDFHSEKDTIIRVENMSIALISFLKKYSPDIVAIEKPPYCNSPDTLIMLSEIVGCVKGWAINNGSDFVEYPVNKWRKLIADKDEKIPRNRNDAKPWDINKVIGIFGQTPTDDNEADAILVGLARIKQFEADKCLA